MSWEDMEILLRLRVGCRAIGLTRTSALAVGGVPFSAHQQPWQSRVKVPPAFAPAGAARWSRYPGVESDWLGAVP